MDETTFTRGDERIVVQHENSRVVSAQKFRDDELVATTTDPAVIKAWMANPN
jgi:hypothetical protein